MFCTKTTYLSTYPYYIWACNGPDKWLESDLPPINHHDMRRAPGRPKKMRNKSNDEPIDEFKLPRQQANCEN